MTKVIIISESNLDGFYEQTLKYWEGKYLTNYPTSLSEGHSEKGEGKYIDECGYLGNGEWDQSKVY